MSGGEQPVEIPKPTEAEIIARLIEIGERVAPPHALPDPHTVWVIEKPTQLRCTLEEICHMMPVGHLERFPWYHIGTVFFAYKDQESAFKEADKRISEINK